MRNQGVDLRALTAHLIAQQAGLHNGSLGSDLPQGGDGIHLPPDDDVPIGSLQQLEAFA